VDGVDKPNEQGGLDMWNKTGCYSQAYLYKLISLWFTSTYDPWKEEKKFSLFQVINELRRGQN
jgi:hypothetical protein